MPEQPQSVAKCSDLRTACQHEIFIHIDKRHTTQMEALSEIKEQLAFKAGQENGRKVTGENSKVGKRDWAGMVLKALFNWGPAALFLIVLGAISWLRSKGWIG